MKPYHIITLLVGLATGGLAYWFQPYNQTTVLGVNMWLIMGVGAFLESFIILIFFKEKPLKIVLPLVLGVIIAVLFRIIYDTIFWDSTSHNLAPFEILFAAVVTFPSALFGSYLGVWLRKTKN